MKGLGMTPKQRVIAALSHKEPDRVPTDLGGWVTTISVKTYQRLLDHLGLDLKAEVFDWLRQNSAPHEEVLKILGVDTRKVYPGKPASWKFEPEQTEKGWYVQDEWGCGFIKNDTTLYYNLIHSPLKDATIADLDSHPWPDPCDPGYLDGVGERARSLAQEGRYAVVGDFAWESWFERAWKLRGMERFYMDMVANRDFIHAILDKTVELHLAHLELLLGACGQDLDVIIQGGDLAGQNTTLMSPADYREFIKPRQARVIKRIKELTPAKVFWHSCGAVESLVEDFIEVGIDILNPVQVRAKGMQAEQLKEKYSGRIAFWGGVDSQRVLPYGSREDVENEVRHLIRALGPGGGLVVCSVHNIQADVPEENVLALYEAVKKWGVYPV